MRISTNLIRWNRFIIKVIASETSNWSKDFIFINTILLEKRITILMLS